MSRPTITIHDSVTDKIVTREMNDLEFAAYEAEVVNAQAEAQAKAQAEADKAAAKLKLAALGLTTDDLKALGL
jgi:hypothetical protein